MAHAVQCHSVFDAPFPPRAIMQSLFVVTVLACLLIGGLTAYVRAAETTDAVLAKAVAAWEKKQPEEALKLAAKAIELDPKNTEAYLLRGKMYEARDKHTEAIA